MTYRRRIARAALATVAGAGLVAAAAVALGGPAVATPTPAPPFTQCPAIGADLSGCALLIVINPGGGLSFVDDPSEGPYDGSEDTLIGVQNNSGHAVNSLDLSADVDAFGFDGDGLCTYTFTGSSGCPFGTTGYEGPNTSFSNIASDGTSGTVNFTGGLADGGSAYFSLEEAVTAKDLNSDDAPATGSCTKTYTGTVQSPVVVAAGSVTCIINAAVVSGSTVSVPTGAQLVVTDSTVKGSISALKSGPMTICNSTIGGSITVSTAGGFVVIGDGGDAGGICPGNTIKGAVTLSANTGGIELGANTITGSVVVQRNVAPNGNASTEDDATELEANSIGGALVCLSNTPAPTNDSLPNTVKAGRSGQCGAGF